MWVEGGPAFELLGEGPPRPFLFTAEHAGALLPPGMSLAPGEQHLLERHWGIDLGVRWVTEALVDTLGGVAVVGLYSRLFLDLNRGELEPSLCPELIEGRPLSINVGITPEERRRRVEFCHHPYHQAIDHELRLARVKGINPILMSLHSFTPEPLGGIPREFDIGVLFDDFEGEARALALELSRVGFRVRLNEPYSGRVGLIYAARRHGHNLAITYLELEINQALLTSAGDAVAVAGRVALGLENWYRSENCEKSGATQ